MASKLTTILVIILLIYLISLTLSKTIDLDPSDKIAVIPITGVIVPQDTSISFYQKGADAGTIITFLDRAMKSDKVKGIILEINSPGGTVVASKNIAEKVQQSEKPVVAVIKDVGASGAYWVASAADIIVADPLSITGSIGVTASYLEFSKLFDEYGITYQPVKAGEYKDIGSPFKELSGKEQALVQKKLDTIHEVFIKEVANNRELPEATVRKLANGIYYLGQEAYDHKLVDYLGNKELAINLTKEQANIEKAKLVTYKEEKSIFDVLSSLSIASFYSLGRGIGESNKIKSYTIPTV
jgi:protease IV